MTKLHVIAILLIYRVFVTLTSLPVITVASVLPWKTNTSSLVDVIPNNGKTPIEFFWSAVGLVILIGSLQTLVTTIVVYVDKGGMWTFRFCLA
jgi:hypothetical protein